MMYKSARFKYGAGSGYQMLELPYKGKKLSMVVVLPGSNGLAALEKSVNAGWLTQNLARMYKRKVHVYLPRFKTTVVFRLGRPLKAMGMKQAFTDAADFSGITGGKDLKISAVIHKAFVHVNEEGTEAAAATAIVMVPTSVSRTPVFRADRPFLFLIRHNSTGTILFMGRIHDPTK
jgi:serpin B